MGTDNYGADAVDLCEAAFGDGNLSSHLIILSQLAMREKTSKKTEYGLSIVEVGGENMNELADYTTLSIAVSF